MEYATYATAFMIGWACGAGIIWAVRLIRSVGED